MAPEVNAPTTSQSESGRLEREPTGTQPAAEVPETSQVSRRPPRRGWWVLVGVLATCFAAVVWAWPWARTTHCLNVARQALERGDPRAALLPLQEAEHLQPQRAEVQYLRAVALRRAGRFDECRDRLQRAKTLQWPASDIERQEWLAVAQSGDVDAVRDRLLAIIDRGTPDDVAEEIYEALARGYSTAYRLRDAWQCLYMWQQWRPDAPQARLARAYIYEQLDQIPAAVQDYRAALERLPQDRETHLKLAELLLGQGSTEEAETHFRACLASPSDVAEAVVAAAFLGVARCSLATGHAAEARRCLEAALALHLNAKQQGVVLAEMGRLMLQEGQADEALHNLQQAVQLAPAEISIHRTLAAALTRAGQTQQAKLEYDRAREIEAGLDRVGDIQRALIEKPNDAELRCEAGKILLDQGLAANGVGWLLTALKYDPNHRHSHQLLAEYYATAGNQTLAAHHRLLAANASQPR
ncbi:MAG: tetratricopeptide repeat protein [Planctomycetota bacterium]|nr:tetratricopeptide repeat protein [Planctomycetota bacterium]